MHKDQVVIFKFDVSKARISDRGDVMRLVSERGQVRPENETDSSPVPLPHMPQQARPGHPNQ